MKRLALVTVLMTSLAASAVNAEDTDIYINTTAESGAGEAYVMIALDWRPNLSSSVCPDTVECTAPGEWSEQCSGTYVAQCPGTESEVCSDTGCVTTCTDDLGNNLEYVDVCDGTVTQVCQNPETNEPVPTTTSNTCEQIFGDYMPEKDICVADNDICVNVDKVTQTPAVDGSCAEGFYLVPGNDSIGTVLYDGTGSAVCPAGTTFQAGDYTFFQLIIAALKFVVEDLPNVHLGLMMSHVDTRESDDACTGPNPPNAYLNCGNGGFIFSGFKDMDDPQQKEDYFTRMENIPLPAGNEAHQYQGREMYFEFTRYLTGQRVYNGHNGWGDYGTDNDDGDPINIDDPLDIPPYLDQSSLWFNTFPTVLSNGSWDKTIEEELADGTYRYIAPDIGEDVCAGVSVLNLMHQVANQQVESDDAIAAPVCYGDNCLDGGLGLPKPKGGQEFPDIINWLVDADRLDSTTNGVKLPSIRSFFLVDESKINTKTTNYAQAGLSQLPYALGSDPSKLKSTLGNIFAQILSTSTTFVAPSVPVNVFNRAEALSNVYISLFQPAEEGTPQWSGNLKMLKLDYNEVTGARALTDQRGDNAVGADGRIAPGALTFWTIADELTPPEQNETDFTADSDGRGVRRGGAGQVMPGARDDLLQLGPGLENPIGDTTSFTARKLFTAPSSHTNGIPDALLPFNATVETADILLGDDPDLATMLQDFVGADPAAVQSEMLKIMRHARGIDVTDEDGDGLTDDSRPWFFGPGLHGRPLPINYGGADAASQEVRVLMTNNDGWVRMFGTADTDGVEDWAFMPREVIPKLKRLMDNVAGVPIHPHLVDGDISMLMVDNDNDGTIEAADGDRVIAVFGQRRGGKTYWALDVTGPDDPRLLWSISKSCTAEDSDFCELGQTWSPMRAVKLSIDDDLTDELPAQDKLAFIFAGGYNGDDDGDKEGDLGKDARDRVCLGTEAQVCDGTVDPTTGLCDVGLRTACFDNQTGDEISYRTELLGTNDDEGNAIYIVDGFTGELLWKAIKGNEIDGGDCTPSNVFCHPELNDSIPSEIGLLDSDSDGRLDRFYVGDTGGVLWRGDTVAADLGNWTLTKIASVGRHWADAEVDGGATVPDDRRYFPTPDIVRSSDALGDYDGIVIGSGDRAHPLGNDVQNNIYLFKDRNLVSGNPPSDAAAIGHDDVLDLTDGCLDNGNLSDCNADVETAQAQLNKGWRIQLIQCEDLQGTGDCGEKSLSSPLIAQGVVLFNTYIPADPDTLSCAPKEGEGLLYAVSLEQAAPVLNFDSTNDGDGIQLDRFDKLASGGIPSQLVPIGYGDVLRGDLKFTNLPGFAGAKTFWYEEDRN